MRLDTTDRLTHCLSDRVKRFITREAARGEAGMSHAVRWFTGLLALALIPSLGSGAFVIDGDVDPEIAGADAALLTASPVDGPGDNSGGPPTNDYGADGSLIELYGGIDGQDVYIAVRGDFFGADNGDNNAIVVLINVDPGAGTGAIGSGDLSDVSGIRDRVTMKSLDDWFSVVAGGAAADGFDAAIIVNAAFGDWEAVGWTPVVGSGAGTPAAFETLGGAQYGYDTSVAAPTGNVAPDGTFALSTGVGENAFEVLIPRSQLGIGSQTGGNIEIACYVPTNDVGGINPNTLPENSDETYDGLTDFDGGTQQIPAGVPSSAILGPIPAPTTIFDVAIDFSTETVVVNSTQVEGTATAGATIDVTTDLSGNSVSATVGPGNPGTWEVTLPNPLVDGDVVTAEDAVNARLDTKQTVAEDIRVDQQPAGATAVTGEAQGGATVQIEINGVVEGTTTAGAALSLGAQPFSYTTAAALGFKDIVTVTDLTNTETATRTDSAMAGIDGNMSDLIALGATELTLQVVATGFGENYNQIDNVYCAAKGDSLIIGIGGNLEASNSLVLYFNTDTSNDTGNDTVPSGTFASPVLDDIILPVFPEYGFTISNIFGRRTKMEDSTGATLFDAEFMGNWPNDATSEFEDQVWADTSYGLFAVAYSDRNDSPSPPGAGQTVYGFELCIPAAALGFPEFVEIVAGIDNGEGTWFSNQTLPPMDPGTGNLNDGTPDLVSNGCTAALDLPCAASLLLPPEFLDIRLTTGDVVQVEWKARQAGTTILEQADPYVTPWVWTEVFRQSSSADEVFTFDAPPGSTRWIYQAGQLP
jgi:hypothetical protein